MEQFGKYQLIRRIGVGGMAEVFLARTPVAQGLSKDLVIKKIHPAYARSRHFLSMFVAEAKIALGLNHPNIVQVFDFGTVGGTFFLAMEYIEGVDLLRLLSASQHTGVPMAPEISAYIVQEVARGLDYAHRKADAFGEPLDIVHRDVSPQNVLVSWDGAVKLVDFGVARARDVHEEEGVIKGKCSYMSPEQARGEPVDRRADVYAAAVVLFELCCGRPLFRGKSKEILAQVRAGAIVRPREVAPEVPEALEAILLEALAYHPDERFQTARELQAALGRFVLERAQRTGNLVDASMLAQMVADMIPAEERGPAAPSAASARASRDSTGGSLLEHLDTGAALAGAPAPLPRETRERKHVLVLSGHACAAAGAPATAALPPAFLQVVRDIAFKHHAHVHALDAAGLVLVVGVPVATEDDPNRAIHLSLALIDALDAIGHEQGTGVRLGLGLQRGVAIVDRGPGPDPGQAGGPAGLAIGAIELGEWTGAVCRRLSRDAGAAEVLVSGGVYHLTRGDWRFEEAVPLHVTDTEAVPPEAERSLTGEPIRGERIIRVHRLLGPKHRAERLREHATITGELIGRELELKALRDAYREVLMARTKRPVLLAGEPGVGKRALVNAFLDGIPAGEAVVLRAMSRVAASHTPYAVFADLARDLLGLDESAPADEVRQRLQAMAPLLYSGSPGGGDALESGDMVDTVYRLLTGDGPADGIDAEEHRQRVLQAMLRVEQRMARDRPLVLVGEDAHWSDNESLALFRRLFELETHRPVLGIVTTRPDTRVARMAAEIRADIIRLEELDPDSSAALITRRFAPGQDVSELVRQILARTGGNALFIREVLESLIERGTITEEDSEDGAGEGIGEGAAGAAALLGASAAASQRGARAARRLRWVERDAPIQVPSSVETLLATRIDNLPAREKETLLHAAVLGRTFRPDAVGHLLDRLAEDDLEALRERDILRVRDGRYTFRSNMMMTVAYGLLPADERSRLHRRRAERLAASAAYRGGQDDAMIARHLELAGDASAAAERYLRAATHASEVGASGDALRLLTRALRLLPADRHEHRFAVHRQREETLRLLARKAEQLREIHGMGQEAEALGDPARQALAYARLARFHLDAGKTDAADRAAGRALDHARAAGDRLAEAEALRLRAGVVLRLEGNGAEALLLCQQALALCENDDGRPGLTQRAAVLNSRGTSLWSMGRLEDAIESFAEALIIYRTLRVTRQETIVLSNMGVIFSALGEYEEALAHYKSSLQLTQTMGDRASVALKLANIGQTYADVGDFERAERYLRKGMKVAEQLEDDEVVIDAAVTLGQVYWQQDALARAQAQFERGLALARVAGSRFLEIRAEIYLAMSRLEAGHDPAEVLAMARVATEQAERLPMPVGQIYGLAVQGQALAALGRAGEAADASARAVALQAARKQSESPEHILYIHAVLCEAAGRGPDATQAIHAARRAMNAKAARLRNPKLRSMYLDAKISRAIIAAHARMTSHARQSS